MDNSFYHEGGSSDAWEIIDVPPASMTPASESGYETALPQEKTEPGGMSDADLACSALGAIERHGLVTAGKVSGIVRNGWLILEGAVRTKQERRSFEAAVRHLEGIRGVSNNIAIESEVLGRRVQEKISETFRHLARAKAPRVSVAVSDKTVILSGCVQSETEREAAEAAAWSVEQTVSVINRVRVAER